MGNNYNREGKINKYLHNFEFKNINYPLIKKDYETFEDNSKNISLIVQKADDDSKEVVIHYKSVH